MPSIDKYSSKKTDAETSKMIAFYFLTILYICICIYNNNIISLENDFTNRDRNKTYKINFDFDCNIQCVMFLITCKVCQNQYVGSTITIFRKCFLQNNSNIKLYPEGIFFTDKHGTYDGIKVQITDYFDAKFRNAEKTFGFLILTH